MSYAYVLIPLLPLLASAAIALTGRRLGESSRIVGMSAVGASFVLSAAALAQLILTGEPIFIPLYELLHSGSMVIDLGLYIDQLTVLLLLLVTGVSFVVHVYSSHYMVGDERYSRFFAVMALFTFGMITLVMSSNLLMMFMCWEVMGVCSYLLISHQADRPAACRAATKAFLVNAVADVGLLLGVVLTAATFETLDIRQVLDQAAERSGQTINLLAWMGFTAQVPLTTVIVLLVFMGCLGKSAQLPFHVWLPNAMEAPTPVSALIHAATMVNAGPFLLVRLSPLVMLSPTAMTIIAATGAATALLAGSVSLAQTDIKRILAYSTISQIGFMIMTCGLGAFVAAIFHMMAHGCLKAFLFLSTGSQLEAVAAHGHAAPDEEQAGAPWSLYAGALILACVPPLVIFAGPYEALWMAHDSTAARVAFWAIGLLTVFFTAIHLCHLVATLFRPDPNSVLRPQLFSPSHMLPVAAGSLGVIGILLVVWSWFSRFLAPALGGADLPAADWLTSNRLPWLALPLLAAVSGWLAAWTFRPRRASSSSLAVGPVWANRLYVLLLNKLYFDEVYTVYVIRPVLRFVCWLWREVDVRGIDRAVVESGHRSVVLAHWLWERVDVRVIDRAVESSGGRSVGLAHWLWQTVDVRRIDSSAERIGRAADTTGQKLQEVEPRTLQHHLLVLIFWLVVAIGFFYWLVL